MGPILHLLVALVLGLSIRSGGEFSLPGVLLVMAAYYAAGRALAGTAAGAAEARAAEAAARSAGAAEGAAPRDGVAAALGRFRRAAGIHRLLGVPAFAWILWAGGWAGLRDRASQGAGEFAGLAVALAPYFLLLLLHKASTWPAERRLGLQRIPFLRSVVVSTRVGALVVVPILLLLAGWSAAALLAAARIPPFGLLSDLAARYDFVFGFLLLAGLAATFVLFPVAAMRILGARPLPAGPLRSRLEGYARRVGLRYRDLYLWPTEGTLPNAAVLGIGARFRCVVFTDALLDQLDDEEVEAVFGHEAGHALHHHLPLFFLFTVGYILSLFLLMRVLPLEWVVLLESDPLAQGLFSLAGFLLFFGLIFGFVSRRLEQQADVHGLLTLGLPEGEDPGAVIRDPARHPFLRAVEAGTAEPRDHPFVRSLEGLAASMGGIREITGWRHFSLGDRIAFLDRYARDPAVRDLYRRRLRALLGVMGAALLLFAGGAATAIPVQLEGPEPQAAFGKAMEALERADPAAARRWLEDGLRGSAARGIVLGPGPSVDRMPPGRPAARLAILRCAQAAGDPEVPAAVRVRYREAEALLRSLAGEKEAAAETAADAARMTGAGRPPEPPPEDPGRRGVDRFVRGLRAESLLLLGDLLREAGRPAAARAAWEDAAREAEAAGEGGTAYLEAAKGRL